MTTEPDRIAARESYIAWLASCENKTRDRQLKRTWDIGNKVPSLRQSIAALRASI